MKEALLLLHGALGSKAQLKELHEKLSNHFEVYEFNFEGHGGRTVREPFTIDLFVDNTLAFMEQAGITASHFFGYSMGGYVALKLASGYPDKVKKVITLGTKFNWTPESAAKEVRMMNPEVIEQKIPAFAATLRERHKPEDWKKIMRLTAEMMTAMGDGAAMTPSEFHAIEHQVLICIGTEDHMVTLDESAKTADTLKNGSLRIIEGFRHPLEAVDIAVLAGECTSFLRES